MSEEEAQACGGEDVGGDDEVTPGYKAPKKVDLQTIQQMDQDDEALVKYKQELLGKQEDVKDEGGPNVLVKEMAIVVYDPANPRITLSEHKMDLSGDVKDQTLSIEEGCSFSSKIVFRVQREIVCGLRYSQKASKKGIMKGIKDKSNLMVGSYPPKTNPHEFITKAESAPSGMALRGDYIIASLFTDDDKNIYKEWSWTLKITKKGK